MQRRQFLAASLAASAAAAVTTQGNAQSSPAHQREYYLWRRYNVQQGAQSRLTESFFSGALLPALGRMGIGPVGAFRIEFGNDTPAFVVLVPSTSTDTLVNLDHLLAGDAEFAKAAAPFWNSTAASPAFLRYESSILAAFPGWPRITPPDTKAKRVFQVRTYDSPSNAAHVRKLEMFDAGEYDLFHRLGFRSVFYGDMLVGTRQPCLSYMLAFESKADMEAKWDLFRSDPGWTKLSTDPRFTQDELVTNIQNLILNPLSCSQV